MVQGVASLAHCLVQLTGLGRLVDSIGEQSLAMYLEEFESRLRGVTRPEDKLLKLATDKYLLIFTDVRERHLLELAAAKLARSFHQPMDCIGALLPFDFHAGMVVPSDPGLTSKDMTQHAERALRLAISTDQPYVIVEPGEDAESDKPDPSLLPRIERGVEQGEFVLYFQPKISAAYQNVVGAEGLVRWVDPRKKKVIPPGLFIETVEENAVIAPFTEHLVRSAVSTCAGWDRSLSVAVNLTPRLLENDAMISVISDALDFYALEPDRLTLEITERGELPVSTFVRLEALRDIGVKISIDDFGTGQCSLMYFRDLPADEVKIDQAFVGNMRKSKKDLAIVRGIIDLSHHCGMTVVAEGIEDQQTADLLLAMNCDVLQGYHFGRPVSLEDFSKEHLSSLTLPEEGGFFSRLLD